MCVLFERAVEGRVHACAHVAVVCMDVCTCQCVSVEVWRCGGLRCEPLMMGRP